MQDVEMQHGPQCGCEQCLSARQSSKKLRAPYVIGGIIAGALLLLGWIFVMGDDEDVKMKQAMEEKKKEAVEEKGMKEEEKRMEEKSGDAMMEEGSDVVMMEENDQALMEKAGTYDVYDASKFSMAKEGSVVLFFRASWCPTCRALDADIRKNLPEIPSDVTILDVDYDKYGDLKEQYRITTQHTLVQVDANGKELGRWVGSMNLAELVKNVK